MRHELIVHAAIQAAKIRNIGARQRAIEAWRHGRIDKCRVQQPSTQTGRASPQLWRIWGSDPGPNQQSVRPFNPPEFRSTIRLYATAASFQTFPLANPAPRESTTRFDHYLCFQTQVV
ncbi:hypothetical protein N7522_011338 [Penicillium canescens]|nr:hypothetical protein N7522_011338 [Penicillium canescens]